MVKRKLTDENILSLHRLYNNGLSSCAIAKKFNTYPSNILYHLRKLEVAIKTRSSAAKEGVRFGRIKIKKHVIPVDLKMNADLSYLLGVLAGDGYIDYNDKRQTYQVALSAVDREFVEKFRKTLFNFFKIKPTKEFREKRKENWNPQYITRLCSKEVCDYINQISNFKGDVWRIPDLIKDSDESVKCAFLKGFFDSEGEIDRISGRVGATSINLEGLKEIGILLSSFGIRWTIIKKKDLRPNTSQKYVLRIHDKKSIRKFYNLIGFIIRRKQKILEAVLFPRDTERLIP